MSGSYALHPIGYLSTNELVTNNICLRQNNLCLGRALGSLHYNSHTIAPSVTGDLGVNSDEMCTKHLCCMLLAPHAPHP